MRVAFLGLGAMGYPMAGHISGGYETVVWNRTSSVAEKHAAEFGTRAAGAVADAVAVDFIFTCLPTSREVDALVDAVAGALPSGAIWVDCTSGDPKACRTTSARLAALGVTYLDAPVSGGVVGAKAGQLSVMAGGAADVLDRARPMLEKFASRIVHCGPTGAGNAVKAVNNALMAINLWSASEGLLALERSGVDIKTSLEVINASSGRSFATESLLPNPLTTGEFPLWFKLALLQKDSAIAADVARDAGQPAPLIGQIADLLGMARGSLDTDADYREVARALKAWQVDIPGRTRGAG